MFFFLKPLPERLRLEKKDFPAATGRINFEIYYYHSRLLMLDRYGSWVINALHMRMRKIVRWSICVTTQTRMETQFKIKNIKIRIELHIKKNSLHINKNSPHIPPSKDAYNGSVKVIGKTLQEESVTTQTRIETQFKIKGEGGEGEGEGALLNKAI